MKLARAISLTMLSIIAFIGLISTAFLPKIEATFNLSAGTRSHTTSTSTATTHSPKSAMPMVLAQDAFQRTDHLFWGTASDGQMWEGDANSKQSFTVMNHSGRIVGQGAYNAILGPLSMNADIVFSGSLTRFQRTNIGAVLHWQDGNNWYKAFISGKQLILLKDVAGTMTQLNAVPFTANVNTFYTLRFRAFGSQLVARVWQTGQVEPRRWMVQATDSTFTTGFGGLRMVVADDSNATIATFIETAATTL